VVSSLKTNKQTNKKKKTSGQRRGELKSVSWMWQQEVWWSPGPGSLVVTEGRLKQVEDGEKIKKVSVGIF
jgi:hypothetical protein